MLFDTHCHLFLDPLGSRCAAALDEARAVGVETVVVPAFDVASWPQVEAVCRRPDVWGAVGLHPWKADQWEGVSGMGRWLDNPKIVAVGEVGLDARCDVPMDLQERVFRDQLAIAARRNLAVLVHCVGAFDRLFPLIAEFPHVPVVVHGFSRGPQLARRLVDAGCVVGIGGMVTRPKAASLRAAVRTIPLSSMVLETDAPSLGTAQVPPPHSGPAQVAEVAAAVAAELDIPVDRVAMETSQTARRVFRLPLVV